jgi:16S rRNA (adenine1518-N6/adenine1519-N6)-dimethyltransferase
MFQKEVAERVASPPGSKKYGIISVLLQAYYDIEYLFTVDEDVFTPPPKVKSGVIQLTRNKIEQLPCDEQKFKTVVKTAFNQRRKTMRNSLKSLISKDIEPSEELALMLQKRPEQLSVEEFIWITKQIDV